MMETGISLYHRSRNCYQAFRGFLSLSPPNTVTSYFWTLYTPGSVTDCPDTLPTNLNIPFEKEKYFQVHVDKIHIKLALRYQGNHPIAFFT